MQEQSDQVKLKQVIIENSASDKWIDAKKEWKLITIFNHKNHCVCGHFIMENCMIENTKTKKQLIVGNVCINHFKEKNLSIPFSLRNNLKRISNIPQNTHANDELIILAHRLHILSDTEKNYYIRIKHGAGSRKHFDKKHIMFNENKYRSRLKFNILICLGFQHDRPLCKCNILSKPRKNKKSSSFFFSCPNWPNGCTFNQNADITNLKIVEDKDGHKKIDVSIVDLMDDLNI